MAQTNQITATQGGDRTPVPGRVRRAFDFSDATQCVNLIVYGCMEIEACNFNVNANTDDGSCWYAETYYDCQGVCLEDSDSDGVCDALEIPGCTDSEAFNFDSTATDDDGSCIDVVEGCTDEGAQNYESDANTDNGAWC